MCCIHVQALQDHHGPLSIELYGPYVYTAIGCPIQMLCEQQRHPRGEGQVESVEVFVKKCLIDYIITLHLDALHASSVRIKSWPDAIKWLLRSYLKDEVVQDMFQYPGVLLQRLGEKGQSFKQLLRLNSSRLSGLYPK